MPKPLTLTPRSRNVYDFIVAFKQDNDGVSPSVSEIGAACDINSTSVTRYHLDCLVRLGMIECEYAGKSRMIKVVGGRWIPPKGPAPHNRAGHVVSLSSLTE